MVGRVGDQQVGEARLPVRRTRAVLTNEDVGGFFCNRFKMLCKEKAVGMVSMEGIRSKSRRRKAT
jgi:hypothetical protein